MNHDRIGRLRCGWQCLDDLPLEFWNTHDCYLLKRYEGRRPNPVAPFMMF